MGEWALAFGVTLAVEVPVYVAVLVGLVALPLRRAALQAVAVNAMTHPLVWLVLHPDLGDAGRYGWAVLLVEGLVCVAEAAWLRWRAGRETVLLAGTALFANAASVLAGVAVYG